MSGDLHDSSSARGRSSSRPGARSDPQTRSALVHGSRLNTQPWMRTPPRTRRTTAVALGGSRNPGRSAARIAAAQRHAAIAPATPRRARCARGGSPGWSRARRRPARSAPGAAARPTHASATVHARTSARHAARVVPAVDRPAHTGERQERECRGEEDTQGDREDPRRGGREVEERRERRQEDEPGEPIAGRGRPRGRRPSRESARTRGRRGSRARRRRCRRSPVSAGPPERAIASRRTHRRAGRRIPNPISNRPGMGTSSGAPPALLAVVPRRLEADRDLHVLADGALHSGDPVVAALDRERPVEADTDAHLRVGAAVSSSSIVSGFVTPWSSRSP